MTFPIVIPNRIEPRGGVFVSRQCELFAARHEAVIDHHYVEPGASDEELKELYERIKGRYEETLDPRYAAARLWVDGVIFPHETRKWLIKALEACALNPEREPFRIGVFQV